MSHRSRKNFSWGAAMRDIKSDRAERPEVRFEPSRSSAAFRMQVVSGIGTGAWRGKSGRRYVVGTYPANHDGIGQTTGAVYVAVAVAADGTHQIKSVRSYEANDGRLAGWLEQVVTRLGATEVHVHRIAETAAARAAMLEDLGARATPPAEMPAAA